MVQLPVMQRRRRAERRLRAVVHDAAACVDGVQQTSKHAALRQSEDCLQACRRPGRGIPPKLTESPLMINRPADMLGRRTSSAAHQDASAEQVEEEERQVDAPKPKRAKKAELVKEASNFRIKVVTMAGAAISIDDASAADTIRSVKQRVFAVNRKLPVRRQRLVYSAGPRGMEALADDETLGGAGVARDGSAELDVLLVDLTAEDAAKLGRRFLNAALHGRANMLIRLLDEGVDVDFKSDYGTTALIYAMLQGSTECVRVLVERGANTEVRDGSGSTPLILAATHTRSECARLLLDGGADKNAKDNYGQTALICSALDGRTECVRLLVRAGADTEAMASEGNTALIYASVNGHTECVRLLLEGGANKGATDSDGLTALDHARERRNSSIVALLR